MLLIFQTAAELERRLENFTKELDFVFADLVMAIIADFMLVWLPAPTVSLRPPLSVSAGRLAKFFYGCPDNAFQVPSSRWSNRTTNSRTLATQTQDYTECNLLCCSNRQHILGVLDWKSRPSTGIDASFGESKRLKRGEELKALDAQFLQIWEAYN
ncbi:hypothetical protein ACE6H2_006084 [Prunus campanulata]